MRRFRSWLHLIVPFAALLIALGLHIRAPRFVENFRFQVFDAYQRLAPRPHTDAPVVIIDIDDSSLRRLGQWPWPRTLVAKLVRTLDEAGAAAIGLDLLLAEPDRSSPENVFPLWDNTEVVARARRFLEYLPEHDAVLAEELHNATVVTGFALTPETGGKQPPRPYTITINGPSPLPVLPGFTSAVTNLPRIDADARGVGGFNFQPRIDGVLRQIPLLLRLGRDIYPSFSAEMLRVALGADGYEIRVEEGGLKGVLPTIEEVAVGGLVIPTDPAGRMWIHYTRPQARRPFPAWQVLAGEFESDAIAGRVTVVGTSAVGLKDLRTTPLDLTASGVTVHAVALEQMLLGHFLERPAWVEPVELIYMLGFGLSLIFLMRRFKALGCLLLGLAAVAVAVGLSWYAYTEHRLLIDPVLPSLVALLVYMTASLISFANTEAERHRVRSIFGHYLAPAVVQQLMDNPGTLRLGGERRETTFLFTDLAGFTSLTEKLEPTVLVRVLNEYLDGACRVVLNHSGTIDKFVGDALYVMFNAPGDQPDHAERAIRCALELDEYCNAYAGEQRVLGIDLGDTRIGINTGAATVGNFGGTTRFDYTAYGDAVNTAARLESANKYFNTRICVSESTLKRCAYPHHRPIGRLVFMGKTKGINVHEIITTARAQLPEIAEYKDAYQLLQGGDPAAADAFADLVRRYPDDGLIAFHAARLATDISGVTIKMVGK